MDRKLTEQKTVSIITELEHSARSRVSNQQRTRRARRQYPLALRPLSILFFGILLVVLSITIVILWHFSQKSNGFALHNSNHYLLTYGPTAILIWIVAVWRQLDHQIKISTPWKELYNGNTSVLQTLLADYVTCLQPVAVWTALQNKHWSVVLTILGFIFLKVATLSSTTLLAVDPVAIRKNVTGTMETAFVPRFYNADNDTSTFDPSLLYTTYGILVEGLLNPFGVGEGLAYPSFSLPADIPELSNLTITLSSFIPSFQCVPANVSAQLASDNSSELNPTIHYQLNSPDCLLPPHSPSIYALNPKNFLCPSRQLSGLIQNINCSSSVFASSSGIYKLLTVADLRYAQVLSSNESTLQLGSSIQASSWGTEIAQITASICRLSYSVQDVEFGANVAKLESTINVIGIQNTNTQKLGSFSDDDLDSLFSGALHAGDSILVNRIDNDYAFEYPDPMFETMASTINGTYADLLDTNTLMKSASRVSVQLLAQIAHQYLSEARSDPQPLTLMYFADRLRLDTLSTWIVSGMLSFALIILARMSIAMKTIYNAPRHETLLDNMSLLGHSPAFVTELLASQKYKEHELRRQLAHASIDFIRQSNDPGTIHVKRTLNTSSVDTPEALQSWWHPMTTGWPFLALTLVLTVSALAVLEIIQRLSDGNAGFLSISQGGSSEESTMIRFVPAAFALLIASLYSCLEFNTLLMSPFHKMKSSASASILSERPLLGRFPFIALWTGLRRKHWAALTSSIAALVGSLLTIVVSGLYSVEVFSSRQSIVLQSIDQLMPIWSNSAINDNGAALVSTLLENSNFDYPVGTFDDIVMPLFQVANLVKGDDYSIMTATLPFWRANLRCISLPQSNITLSVSNSFIQNEADVNATYELPAQCQFGGSNGTDSFITFSQTFTFPITQNTTQVGKLLDLHVGPFQPSTGGSQDEIDPSATKDNPLGCPSLAFIYGSANISASSVSAAQGNIVNIDVCYQLIQEGNAHVEFNNQNFTIDEANLPKINESSIMFVVSNNSDASFTQDLADATAFEYRPQTHFDQTFVIYNNTNGNPFSTFSGSRPPVDPFFQGVFYGRTPLPLSLLSLTTANQTSQIQQGILSFYRRYMAQAMSLNMRIPRQNLTPPVLFNAIAPQALTTRRIVQNRMSKIVLQSMLAFMLVMGIITIVNIRMRKLLPACANPCTMWGQMSLLAGSSYVCVKEREGENGMRNTREDERVRLGWWKLSDGREWYGIDVV